MNQEIKRAENLAQMGHAERRKELDDLRDRMVLATSYTCGDDRRMELTIDFEKGHEVSLVSLDFPKPKELPLSAISLQNGT
jgi:hypothetical protein